MLNILLWNVINLFDGEAGWFLTFLFILAIAETATHAWRWLCAKLQKKFLQNGELIKNATIQASLLPVTCLIWFLTAIQSIDLVSDRLFSETFTSGLKFIVSVSLVAFISWFLLRINQNIRVVLLDRSKRREIALDPGKVYGLAKLVSVVILVISAILLMEVTGVSVNTLIAFGGISGLALAFASQEIVANFFGGIMIHVNQPFALGDMISLPNASLEGTVEEIGWYETCLRSRDKQPIYIPNALFSKAYVINSQRRTHRRVNEKISIRHQDLDLSPAIIDDIRSFLEKHPSVDTSYPILVYIDQVGSAAVELHITVLSTAVDEPEFLRFRDSLLVKAASIIRAHGAEFSVPFEAIVSMDNIKK